ncbi:MAG: hypothetical protein KBA46_04680, partial [Candidatus Omnitrophica bacterium]|nr:hypothetical protein [Candidatus Omnitrophota bacterium]
MNNTQIIRICKAGERAVVLFAVLLLGIANNGLAQSTVQENIAISTYYPSPEVLAVYDLEVAHNMTVSNRLDIRSGGGNFLHGGSSPIEFSMRTNAINTDLRVRFNSDTFVGDTRTYVCPAGQTS